MRDAFVRAHARLLTARARPWSSTEAGEGVISTAIAVLVMAFLGVLMWELFSDTLRQASTDVNSKVNEIGR